MGTLGLGGKSGEGGITERGNGPEAKSRAGRAPPPRIPSPFGIQRGRYLPLPIWPVDAKRAGDLLPVVKPSLSTKTNDYVHPLGFIRQENHGHGSNGGIRTLTSEPLLSIYLSIPKAKPPPTRPTCTAAP